MSIEQPDRHPESDAAPGELDPVGTDDPATQEAGTTEAGTTEADAAEADAAEAALVETELGSALLRRAPKYPRFMIAGAILGVLVALILTFSYPANAQFSAAQVFGFLLLFLAVVGVAVGALVAIVVDRVMLRKSQTAIVERSSTHPRG